MRQELKTVLSVIFLTLSIFNASLASPFVRPKPEKETATTPETKPDPKKLNEAAATVAALKHCLSMDGSLNQPQRLIDAYNNQPDLEHLSPDIDDAAREKALLYTMGRPDIPDFGFLIPNIWRVTGRDFRIKFNAIMSLNLSKRFDFKYGTLAFHGNCKPVMLGEITATGNFQHATIVMPLAFNDKEVKLSYLMAKQDGYNWQIDDLLINDAGITNYIQKDLVPAIETKGLQETTREICKKLDIKELNCN